MTHVADIHTLAGAYALDALPPSEEREFRGHLAACDACREEVAELQATAATLAAATAEPAPASLRARVLASVDVTRQEPPLVTRMDEREPAGRRLRSVLTAAAAAAVIVIVGLTAVTARLAQRIDQLEARSGQVYSVLAAPDARTVTIAGPGDVHARVIVAPSDDQALLIAEGLPALPEDQVYELWLMRDGTPEPAGLFRPGDDGRAVELLAADVSGADAVAVTVEPAGGSPLPTSDPILVGEV